MKSRLDQPALAPQWRWLCVIGILLSTLARRSLLGTSAPTPTPLPLVSLDELRFDDPETERRFQGLHACIQEITAAGWRTTGYKLIGNFYSTHQVTACDRGPYEGKGIEPPCTPCPLTPEEEAAELARAAAHFAEQQRLLRENYREMYVALMQAFPLDRCWP